MRLRIGYFAGHCQGVPVPFLGRPNVKVGRAGFEPGLGRNRHSQRQLSWLRLREGGQPWDKLLFAAGGAGNRITAPGIITEDVLCTMRAGEFDFAHDELGAFPAGVSVVRIRRGRRG